MKTIFGRQFCIFYGVAGVPLCLFTLFVVGQQEKRLIYYISKKLAFGFRENKRKLYWFTTIMVSFGGSAVFIYLSAVVFMTVEGWAYTDAIYFCAISLLTIGFGDYVAGMHIKLSIYGIYIVPLQGNYSEALQARAREKGMS